METDRQNDIAPDATGVEPGNAAGEEGSEEGTSPDTPSAGGARRNLLLRLFRNFACGVRLALLRRVTLDDLCAAPGDLVFLAAADLVLNFVLSFLLVVGAGTFAYPSLVSFFFHIPLMLLLGLLAGGILGEPRLLTAIPVAFMALSLPLELAHAALEGMSLLPGLDRLEEWLAAPHYYRFFWWWTAAALFFLARIVPAPLYRRAAVILLSLALLVLPLWYFPRGDLWIGGTGGSESGELHLTEEVIAAQSRLLDDQLARLLPGRKGDPHLYFVGFAGDASQDVFTRELASVAQLFADRFGAAGRTVILANNPQTATKLPFATATGLGRALERVGSVMSRDDDILFLFLTSHGSSEHVLTVENPPLEPDGLTPEMVRRMLKKSGITWKVIVVSACYAGGFIDPLKDDQTIVITAADATHESFGCSYGENFTWFGRAYFDEALRRTRSFTAAFRQARETIRQWEKEEGETPSNPQIWVGREMEQRLARWEKRQAAGREE